MCGRGGGSGGDHGIRVIGRIIVRMTRMVVLAAGRGKGDRCEWGLMSG